MQRKRRKETNSALGMEGKYGVRQEKQMGEAVHILLNPAFL